MKERPDLNAAPGEGGGMGVLPCASQVAIYTRLAQLGIIGEAGV